MRRQVASLVAVVVLSSCSAAPDGAAPAPTVTASSAPGPVGGPVTLLALGDSWPYGAHCNGCTPFPQLYAQGLKTELSREVTLLNLVTNGGTSNSLRQSLASDPSYGDAVR